MGEIQELLEHGEIDGFSPGGDYYFSCSSCDYCNCSLGGNRFDVMTYKAGSKRNRYEYAICQDCFEKTFF